MTFNKSTHKFILRHLMHVLGDSYSQSYGFFRNHAQMWELDHKEGWVLKNWCFGIVVLEKTLESPLDSKEIKPVNPKGNQPWLFIGKTQAEALGPDVKSWLIGKDTDAGKDWGQEEKGAHAKMPPHLGKRVEDESELWAERDFLISRMSSCIICIEITRRNNFHKENKWESTDPKFQNQ